MYEQDLQALERVETFLSQKLRKGQKTRVGRATHHLLAFSPRILVLAPAEELEDMKARIRLALEKGMDILGDGKKDQVLAIFDAQANPEVLNVKRAAFAANAEKAASVRAERKAALA